jgi:hypothetical protein
MRRRRHRNATGLRRRDVLLGGGSLATSATLSFPAPAIAQGFRQLKMVTDWTETMPGLLSSSRRLAQTIEEVTKGRIKIEVFPANAFVRALVAINLILHPNLVAAKHMPKRPKAGECRSANACRPMSGRIQHGGAEGHLARGQDVAPEAIVDTRYILLAG